MFKKIFTNDMIYKNLYNGNWIESSSNKLIEIKSPVDGSLVGKVQAMSKEEIDRAIANSKEAGIKWAETPINERAEILHKAANILEKNKEEIAEILVHEIAKDRKSSISEVQRTADFFKFTADAGKNLEGESIMGDKFPGGTQNKISIVIRVPLGIVLAISPFNYPINLSGSKIAPALIGGNTVILKPPTQGSISALYLAQVLNEAGLPPGVMNTITGRGSDIGDYILTHPGINFINFTGSTEVGKHIASISTMVPLLMELGGKDAAIVLEDANLEQTASDIVSGAYSYSGQRCTAVKRILATDEVANKLVPLLKTKIENLKVGNPEDNCTIVPLIDKRSADFVQGLIDDAINKGATLVTGNKIKGNLIYPTLFDNVTTDMRLAWEEPFGPVVPIIRVKDMDEAIKIANKSEYGLQSSVFTKDINNAFYIAKKLEVGSVQINGKTERGPDHFPFIGVKSSGMGTQGIKYSIEAMTRLKAIVLNLDK